MARKPDPKHQSALAKLVALPFSRCLARIAVTDRKSPEYIESEVLSSLIRAGYGDEAGVVRAAIDVLNDRVTSHFTARLRTTPGWWDLFEDDAALLKDAVSHFWLIFFTDKSSVSNSEVRFGVFQGNRLAEFMRQKYREMNTVSIETLGSTEDDGEELSIGDNIEDEDAADPLEIILDHELHELVVRRLHKLTKHQRDAYYFRLEMKYEWKQVAAFMGVSKTSAQTHYNAAMKKLLGELK